MSYIPSPTINNALSGIISPVKFMDIDKLSDETLAGRRMRGVGAKELKGTTLSYTIIIVIISAIIFVTVIACYDIIRALTNNYFASLALENPGSNNTQEDIERVKIANSNQLWSTMAFAGICLGISLILLPLLMFFFHMV